MGVPIARSSGILRIAAVILPTSTGAHCVGNSPSGKWSTTGRGTWTDSPRTRSTLAACDASAKEMPQRFLDSGYARSRKPTTPC
jgi:hypothetical protein